MDVNIDINITYNEKNHKASTLPMKTKLIKRTLESRKKVTRDGKLTRMFHSTLPNWN